MAAWSSEMEVDQVRWTLAWGTGGECGDGWVGEGFSWEGN